jgi:2-isopropylmalate synthase
MTREEKIRVARQLEKMRVDVIEAGFAAASPGDFDSIHAIAHAIKDSTICSLARANENDIRRAGEAIQPAKSGRIHTFIATSPIHMEKKLRMSPDQVVKQAIKSIAWAREYTDDVEFSAEDAGRSEIDFLCRIFEEVIKAGATTINVPDTVGYNIPFQYAETMRQLIERVPNADKVVWSVHCHNDLGLAVSNSLAAVLAGLVRLNVRSTASASAQAMLHWKKLSWPYGRAAMSFRLKPESMQRRLFPLPSWSRKLPAIRCSRTKRWLVPMRLHTSQAFIRMAC